jgi:hypothetical protein
MKEKHVAENPGAREDKLKRNSCPGLVRLQNATKLPMKKAYPLSFLSHFEIVDSEY